MAILSYKQKRTYKKHTFEFTEIAIVNNAPTTINYNTFLRSHENGKCSLPETVKSEIIYISMGREITSEYSDKSPEEYIREQCEVAGVSFSGIKDYSL